MTRTICGTLTRSSRESRCPLRCCRRAPFAPPPRSAAATTCSPASRTCRPPFNCPDSKSLYPLPVRFVCSDHAFFIHRFPQLPSSCTPKFCFVDPPASAIFLPSFYCIQRCRVCSKGEMRCLKSKGLPPPPVVPPLEGLVHMR